MKEKINIAFTINNAYSCHLATTLASILSNADIDDELSFYVLNAGDISEENQKRIMSLKSIKDFELEFVYVDNTIFENYAKGPHISTNYRLKMASLLPNLDKVIFMDVDIIVLKSLKKLWSYDISKFYAGLVLDPCIQPQQDYIKKDREKFPEKIYNTGVGIYNLKLWREDNIEEKLLDSLSWYSKYYEGWPDQQSLNMALKDKILTLPAYYNACPMLGFKQAFPWNYNDNYMLKEAFDDPHIIHWAAAPEFKPEKDSTLPYAYLFWKYLGETPYYEEVFYRNFKPISAPVLKIYSGASLRVKNQLSYKLGSEILSIRNNFPKIFILPFTLLYLGLNHKKNQKFYKAMIKINPDLALPPLEIYVDYSEALKCKKHLSYMLGSALLKNPLTFIFKIKSITKDFKSK